MDELQMDAIQKEQMEALRQMNAQVVDTEKKLSDEEIDLVEKYLKSEFMTYREKARAMESLEVIRQQLAAEPQSAETLKELAKKEEEELREKMPFLLPFWETGEKQQLIEMVRSVPSETKKRTSSHAHQIQVIRENNDENMKMIRDWAGNVIDGLVEEKEMDVQFLFDAMKRESLKAGKMMPKEGEIVDLIQKKDYNKALQILQNLLVSPKELAGAIVGQLFRKVSGASGKMVDGIVGKESSDQSKSSTKPLDRLKEYYIELISSRVSTSNPLSRLLLERTLPELKGWSVTYKPIVQSETSDTERDVSHFDRYTLSIAINLAQEEEKIMGKGDVLFHEMAHMTDSLYSKTQRKMGPYDILETYEAIKQKIQEKINELKKKPDSKELGELTAYLKKIEAFHPAQISEEMISEMLGTLAGYKIKIEEVRRRELSSGRMKEPFARAILQDFDRFVKVYCKAIFGKIETEEDRQLIMGIAKRQIFDMEVLPVIIDTEEKLLQESITDEEKGDRIKEAMCRAAKRMAKLDTMSPKYQQRWLKITCPFIQRRDARDLRAHSDEEKQTAPISDIFEGLVRFFNGGEVVDGVEGKNRYDSDAFDKLAEGDKWKFFFRFAHRGITMTPEHIRAELWAEMTEAESSGNLYTRAAFMQFMPHAFEMFKEIRRRAIVGRI